MGSKYYGFVFYTALGILFQTFSLVGATHIGVCYGLNGDNLPPPTEVINLYKNCGIEFLRIYEPNDAVFNALRGSGILVAVGVKNSDVQGLAQAPSAAQEWVNYFITPYANDVNFKWITVGNEIILGKEAPFVASAMRNIKDVLNSIGLDYIIVTTVLPGFALAASYPPSAGVFFENITIVINDVATVLSSTGAPLMINSYPYYAYATDPTHISLDYAMFKSSEVVVQDGPYSYYNLFDAMVDAFYAALEKINHEDISIAIAETGWPSDGNRPFSSIENAQTYNRGVLNHITQNGTPKRPEIRMDTFLFEMFNEDLKPFGVEQNFGFFYPNMQPVYPFW